MNASNAQQHTVNQPSSIPQPTVNSTPQHTGSSSAADDVTFIRKVQNVPKSTTDKYGRQGSMGQYEYDLIRDPNGWLDCVVIHEAHILLRQINNNITGFQRPTLGAVRQFDVMTGDFIQILHVNNNHWVCMTSIDCPNGYVIVLDSMISQVSKELQELAKNLVGPTFKGVRKVRVQQQHNGSDCGVFAIAFSTCLVYGQNPVSVTFDSPRMRAHLLRCLKSGTMELFPTT